MATQLPKLSPPSWKERFDLVSGVPNRGWTQFFDLLYRWLGSGTGVWQGDVAGNAATASTASGVTFILNAGSPEGMQQASPGVHYKDTDSGIVYIKTDGDDTLGWAAIT